MSSTIIIITPPPAKPKKLSDKIEGPKISTYSVEGHEDASDYELLMAAAAQLENAKK